MYFSSKVNDHYIQMMKFDEAMHKVAADPPTIGSNFKNAARWDPYTLEGGSAAIVAGKDFVVAASDMRMTAQDVNVLSRNYEKTFILDDNILFSSTQFQGDVQQLLRLLHFRLQKFRFNYHRKMTVDMCANMLSRELYYKRFFPYYTRSAICGIDEDGNGAIYELCPIGTLTTVDYYAAGSAESIIRPFLDNQYELLKKNNQLDVENVAKLVRDAFRSAAERDTTTGDGICLYKAVQGETIVKEFTQLRED